MYKQALGIFGLYQYKMYLKTITDETNVTSAQYLESIALAVTSEKAALSA